MRWFCLLTGFFSCFLQVQMIFPCKKLKNIVSWRSGAAVTLPVRTNIISMNKVPCDLFRKYQGDEHSEKVSERLLCRAEIFLRVSWWSLIQIVQEGTLWCEKASTGGTYEQVCAGKVHGISTLTCPRRCLSSCRNEQNLWFNEKLK